MDRVRPTFNSHPQLFFHKRPIKWLRVAFYEKPAYSWTLMGVGIAYFWVCFNPLIYKTLGIEQRYEPRAPMNLPQPKGPRKPVDPKYDDPVTPETSAAKA